jgi:hypothetical protein
MVVEIIVGKPGLVVPVAVNLGINDLQAISFGVLQHALKYVVFVYFQDGQKHTVCFRLPMGGRQEMQTKR